MRVLCLFTALAILLLAVAPACADSVSLVWQTPSYADHVRCLGVIEDMDGDLAHDVLVEIDHTNDPTGHFKLLSGADGGQIWGVSPPGGLSNGCGYGDMCVNTSPDLNGDALQEALLGTSWGGRSAYTVLADENGAVLWCFDTYLDDPPSGWIYSIDWIQDVTGDAVPEIIFGCGSDNNRAYCIDGVTRDIVWKFPAPDAVYQVARIGDVNGNGTDDVLLATGDNSDSAFCIDGGSSGIATPIWEYDTGYSCFSICSIGDVDGDLIDDAVIGTWSSGNSVICVSGADGSFIWNRPLDYIMRVVPTDDLDDDGWGDILVASWDNAVICLSGRTGEIHWSVPTGTTNGGDVWTIWPMKDVDNDGYDDVIAGSFDLKAYCVSGHTGDLLWTYTVGNRVYSVRSVADVNGDGVAEALVGTQYQGGTGGIVFCLDADGDGTWVPPVEDVTCAVAGEAVVVRWNIEPAIDLLGYNVYRMAIGDPIPTRLDTYDSVPEALAARAGIGSRDAFAKLNAELLDGSEYVDESVVDGTRYAYMIGAVTDEGEMYAGPVEILADLRTAALWLAPPRPNPCAGSSTIEFAAPAGSEVVLGIYDASGRLVRSLASEAPSGGPGSVVWDGLTNDGTPVASGVYLVRVEAGGETASRKVVVLR